MEHIEYFSAYEGILRGYLQGGEEHFLLQAYELGKKMVKNGLSTEFAADMHFRVIEEVKEEPVFVQFPDLEYRWTVPLLELTTPFGLACPNGSYGVTKLTEQLGTAISDRNLAEEELRKTLEKHTAIIENSLTGIYMIQDGKLEFFNSRFAEIYGYSKQELLGMKPDNLLHPDEKERIREIRSKILTGQVPKTEYEARGVKKSGEIIWVQRRNTLIEHEGKPAILGNIVDITRTKQVEAQLRQAQKMEAMGTLASGVAHDFNNFLSGILGYTELLLMDKTASDPEYETHKKIEFLARKAGDLVRNILVFSRRTEDHPLPCNLNNEVKAVSKLLSSTVAKGIEIDLELEKDLHTINADPTQIDQILLNLCLNGCDAMPEGGRLSIKNRNVFLDESFCQGHPNLKPGNYVELSASDTGCGIDQATISRIFDPFFTTKPAGKGTGLGLSMVHSLVTTHGGDISVHSKPGEGTTFKIYFPAIKNTGDDKTSRPDQEIQNGKGTILFVDDEDIIRHLGKKLVTRLGYDVITARDGEEAIEIFRIAECGMRNEDQRESAIKTNPQSLAQTGFGRGDLPASPVAPGRAKIQNPKSIL